MMFFFSKKELARDWAKLPDFLFQTGLIQLGTNGKAKSFRNSSRFCQAWVFATN